MTVAQLKSAAALIKEKLMTKHNNVFNALRDVDEASLYPRSAHLHIRVCAYVLTHNDVLIHNYLLA